VCWLQRLISTRLRGRRTQYNISGISGFITVQYIHMYIIIGFIGRALIGAELYGGAATPTQHRSRASYAIFSLHSASVAGHQRRTDWSLPKKKSNFREAFIARGTPYHHASSCFSGSKKIRHSRRSRTLNFAPSR